MRGLLLFVTSAALAWAGLTWWSPGGSRSVVPVRQAAPAREASAIPAGPSRPRLPARRPTREPAAAEAYPDAAWREAYEELKVADPWTANNLNDGISRALHGALLEAWTAHGWSEPACAGASTVAPLTIRFTATSELLTLTVDVDEPAVPDPAARACLRAYFARQIVVRDDEVEGPFPDVEHGFPLALPLPLARLFAAEPPPR